jgi:ectoine hydroxylase-related dioxygenase (phytanoyl-CoA dioxygenase family)
MEVSRGSAVAFDAHVVHRSLPNRSDRPRLSGVLRVVNMATQPSPRPLYKALPYSA